MNDVLMLCETEQWEKSWEATDQAERDAGFAKVQDWLVRNADATARNSAIPNRPRPPTGARSG